MVAQHSLVKINDLRFFLERLVRLLVKQASQRQPGGIILGRVAKVLLQIARCLGLAFLLQGRLRTPFQRPRIAAHLDGVEHYDCRGKQEQPEDHAGEKPDIKRAP